ncbi:MAG: hypothetical protein QF489_01670 [Planctomycetota bacterium]|jgi:hypothetical protein|nr:hypothetical protein [Planctomycetota bacterium]
MPSPSISPAVPEEMLYTLLKFCGAVVVSGTLSAASLPLSSAAPALDGNQSTVALNNAVSVVFVGIEGDYKATSADELATWLLEEKKVVVGESIRAMNNADRRVWAIQSEDSKKMLRSLKSGLKKQGFKATPLVATALSPLREDMRTMKSAMRDVESKEKRIWTFAGGGRGKALWAFHESRFKSKDVEALFRKTKSKMAFFHTEFCFQSDVKAELNGGVPAEADLNVEEITKIAAASLDCLKVSTRDGGVVMDLYIRDAESVLLLESSNGRHKFFCPNIQKTSIKRLQVPELNWTVTVENPGMPFGG